ncbi:MAG TPA: ubiquinol-cytochrome c reductase iron-sulfur subunit [Gammaproteobacteria bacterium]|nr:ubiquinol-cytochrome c reductase iron-sulfur subunit [Gammaproteobacteria bacterium]
MSDGLNLGRRRFLGVATGVTSAIGAAFVAVPFLASWKPSARAQALGAPVEVDIGKLDVGSMLRVEWRGKPVWVLKRTPEMVEQLQMTDEMVRDPESNEPQQPDYATNRHRSIKPEVLVVIGSCTHLGCSPMPRFEAGDPALGGAEWYGGFFCACHGSKFDLAGRVWRGVPAPLNLVVPPHSYIDESTVLVGVDTGAA